MLSTRIDKSNFAYRKLLLEIRRKDMRVILKIYYMIKSLKDVKLI